MDKIISAKIEALLIVKGEPISFKYLSKQIGATEEQIVHSIEDLGERYKNTNAGMALIVNNEKVVMTTSESVSEFVADLTKNEDDAELGNAALETLALILYEGPTSRSVIDKIRGVNSTYILRSLMVRGLVERKMAENSTKNYLYKPTLELMAFLGIKTLDELPDKEHFSKVIKDYTDGTTGKNE
ncbi:MAG: SMC-Scp complex subunit ScpB [Candidatus Vogelbacteria bacterium]|nr:SMC-Scp complex subunit ScpB [Candidatus Vogelbacteria bacterium]